MPSTGVRIRDILPQPHKVTVGDGQTIDTRGISLKQTIALLERYKAPLTAFFASPNLDFGLLAVSTPEMVVEIIALGTGTEGQEDDIRLMPLVDQVSVLTEVWEQSVPNIRKLLASLAKAAELVKVAQATESTLQLSNTSSLPSSTN